MSRRKSVGRILAWGCLGGIAAVSAILLEIILFSHREDDGPADAAIVLGAAVFDQVPSPVFEERIRHAVSLFKAGRVRMLVLTGGLGEGDRLTEAEAARRWSMAQGVPSAAIILEPASRTTQENLANALPLLVRHGLHRVVLVSDPLHMRRAMAIARRLGIDAHSSPTPTSRYVGWRSWGGFLSGEAYYLTRCRLQGEC